MNIILPKKDSEQVRILVNMHEGIIYRTGHFDYDPYRRREPKPIQSHQVVRAYVTLQYMQKKGLIERVLKGKWRITELGLATKQAILNQPELFEQGE